MERVLKDGRLKTHPAFITLSVIIEVYLNMVQRLPSGSYEACVNEFTQALSRVKVHTLGRQHFRLQGAMAERN